MFRGCEDRYSMSWSSKMYSLLEAYLGERRETQQISKIAERCRHFCIQSYRRLSDSKLQKTIRYTRDWIKPSKGKQQQRMWHHSPNHNLCCQTIVQTTSTSIIHHLPNKMKVVVKSLEIMVKEWQEGDSYEKKWEQWPKINAKNFNRGKRVVCTK